MAQEWAGLKVFDISDPSSPTELEGYSFAKREVGPTGSRAIELLLTEGLAFAWGSGLHIFDIHAPATLKRVGYISSETLEGVISDVDSFFASSYRFAL